MLRARAGNLCILGLDAENIKRLTAGQPIVVDLAELGGQGEVMLMYGETMADIAQELEDATGKKLPPATPLMSSQEVH